MRYATTKFRAGTAFILCLMVLTGGCATTGGKTYSRNEARQVQTVQRGTIVSLQQVTIEEDPSLIGTGLGGVAGGVIGSTMGRGSGRVLATVGGAAVGALLGTLGEKAVRKENAYEFEIRLDNGSTVSVVQAIEENFSVGDRVRILYSSGNRARVTRDS